MDVLDYAKKLISFDSTSRHSNVDVATHVRGRLDALGFVTEWIDYDDANGVKKANVIGRIGSGQGGLAYFCHTDVVPADDWFSAEHGPFSPFIQDGRLYGRGSCDMKGSLACMLTACQAFPPDQLRAPLYIVCTADEEVGYHGAKQVVQRSEYYREMIKHGTCAVIGEPTNLEVVYAHKGNCSIRAVASGRAAHSSSREGVNANLAMIPFLTEMKAIHDETESDPVWHNEMFDPPTLSWNIGVNDHTSAINMTAARSVCTVYCRPMPGIEIQPLLDRTKAVAATNGLTLSIDICSDPMHTDPNSRYVKEILELAGQSTPGSVAYGTDGGVLGELVDKVVFGPGSVSQAHTRDEWVSLDQLEKGVEMYQRFIQRWCC